MRMSLLLIALIITTVSSTKLILTSPLTAPSQVAESIEVPEIHDHPFSCELMFFNVHQNQFLVNVSSLPAHVNMATLQVQMRDTIVFKQASEVKEGSALFLLLMEKQQESYEVIMDFTLLYTIEDISNRVQVREERKVYMLFCQHGEDYYIVRLPNATIAITQAIGLALMLILPWNVQYRKFLPFTYNIVTSFMYIVVLCIGLYLQMIFGNNSIVFEFQRYFIGMFCFVCLVMYSQDLLMWICKHNKIAFIFGFIFSCAVMGLDFFMPEVKDAWFLNDVISIMVAGAFIKFVIIKKLKTAVWGLGLMWVFCLFRQFAKQFGLQKFDQGLGIRIVPLFLQMPTFVEGDQSSISCSAFGSSKIIAFGMILNYCKRVDIYLSTQFYRAAASILTIVCVCAQLAFNLLFQDLPTIQVMSILLFYPLAVFFLLFFANKRGQWAQIWHGSFYDMAVNRASIPRTVSFEGLESDYGKDLMINSKFSQEQQKYEQTIKK